MSRLSAVEIARALGRPEPTPEQVEVIEAPLQPLLVVAGAGSGKTETMAARVVWLVAGGQVAPDEVLGLTFTRKAAGELAERIRSRLRALRRSGVWSGSDLAPDLDVSVSTYHAFAGRLVREHGLRLGVEPEARLLTEASCWQLATEVVERWAGDMDWVDFAQSTVVDAVLALSGELAEHLVTVEQVDEHLAERVESLESLRYSDSKVAGQYQPIREVIGRLQAKRQVLPLVTAYQEAKRARDSLDFGDQLALAAQLARGVPQLAASLRGQFRAVLLDELQDTSYAQLVMLERLFGAGHGVTAVGDPHQSIYGWRGASADTLAGFADAFTDAQGRPAAVRHLSTSWRNPTSVLEVANLLADPLRHSTTVDVRDLQPRPDAGAGEVEVRSLETAPLEAAAVVDWVAERWLGDDGRPVPGRSAAVLCRKRSQFTDVEAALLARGLPYEVVGIGGLLSTPEVADVVAALHVVHDPTRGDLLVRLLTGPTCRLGAHDLVVLGGWATELHRRRSRPPRDDAGDPAGSGAPAAPDDEPVVAEADVVDDSSLVEALDELPPPGWTDRDGRTMSPEARTRLARLSDTLRDLRGRTALALADLVAEVERALLLDVEVASRPGVGRSQARAHLDALAEVAHQFETTADRATLGAFLSWLAAADEQEHGLEPGQVEIDEHVVQVMTVHAAKGLEWDVVAVPGLVESGFPQHRTQPRNGPTGWTQPDVTDKGWLFDLGAVPYPLRGDASSLPDVRWSAAPTQDALRGELTAFYHRSGDHELAEERRLAYVACTRARQALLLSSHVWGGPTTPRLPSRFLTELVPQLADGLDAPASAVAHVLRVGQVTVMPADGVAKPDDERFAPVPWPVDPLGERRPAVERAASLVRSALAAPEPPVGLFDVEAVAGDGPAVGDLGDDVLDSTVELLLAERDRGRDRVLDVLLPSHVSASRLVELRSDPHALALALRRPVPREPHPATRRGTAFHAWVEQYLGGAAILDVVDLPGAADDADDGDLEQLKARFLASEWAHRRAVAVEVPLETPVDGTVVRGRVDAVFARDDGGVDVVDWKTGRPPTGAAAAARGVQLAAYRLAWHRLHGTPLDQIGAAFVYVGTGETVRPADLLDEAGLLALLRDVDGREL
ncbi:ATP-dependent DNA helicase AdnB [Angustibacter peucedani]